MDFLAREQGQISELLKKSLHEDGPFSDHLKRVYASVCALDEVAQYVRNLLLSNRTASLVSDAYFRLLRTGIVRQNSDGQVIFRCDLYRRYLAEHLL